MKTIFTLFLHLLISFTSISQNHKPLAREKAIWSVNTSKYSALGDTIINDSVYKKFYITYSDTIFNFENADYYAAVRDDNNGKVWAICKDSIKEKLLYDFSLNIGDTTYVTPVEPDWMLITGKDSFKVTVSSIDSILINNEYRQRFKIVDSYGDDFLNEHWIEGVGSTTGLFTPGLTIVRIVDVGYPELLCYQFNDIINHLEHFEQTCYKPMWVNISNTFQENRLIKLVPNPTTGVIHIQTQNKYPKNSKIVISNLHGKTVKLITLSNFDHFNISDLPVGLYIYQLKIDLEIVQSGRLIKR